MYNEFRIYALGDNFDVDAFQAACSTPSSLIWRRGEPKRGRGAPYPTSGIEFNLGDGTAIPHCKQEDIAIAFLKEHRDNLKALGEFPGVTHFTLGLQYATRTQGPVGFCMGASLWLMWHLLDVGCTLSNYVWVEYNDPEDNV